MILLDVLAPIDVWTAGYWAEPDIEIKVINKHIRFRKGGKSMKNPSPRKCVWICKGLGSGLSFECFDARRKPPYFSENERDKETEKERGRGTDRKKEKGRDGENEREKRKKKESKRRSGRKRKEEKDHERKKESEWGKERDRKRERERE